jgi:hypothetical protein
MPNYLPSNVEDAFHATVLQLVSREEEKSEKA